MDQFLLQCKTQLGGLDSCGPVCVILGNEACDLDSAVSALSFSRMLNQVKKYGPVNIPMLNVTREDFPLKTEVVHFLNRFGITSQSLIFRNDVDLESLHSSGKLKLVLVDHNVLCHTDKELESSVIEVVDHHKLECSSANVEMLVEPVGSCCTLVASMILEKAPEILDAELATLLLGTIVLDTANFSLEAKRATAKDVKVADQLQLLAPRASRDQLFAELQKAKEDTNNLNAEQLLRKDVKLVVDKNCQVAVCSLPLLSSKLVDKCQNETEQVARLQAFCTLHNYAALVLVGIEIDHDALAIKRDLTVFSASSSLRNMLCQGLVEHDQPTLGLVPTFKEDTQLRHYCQENVTASRKVILPIVKSLLNSQGGPKGLLSPQTPRTGAGIVGSPLLSVTPATGDGANLEGSSQNSSALNSCPYTPSNSYADDGDLFSEPEQPHQGLLNASTLLAERLESRRGPTGRGQRDRAHGDDSTADFHEENLTAAYPFTPKNSFVDGSFGFEQAYSRFVLNHVDNVEAAIMEKLSREKFFQGEDGNDS